jgi:Zn-dependent peptidase ImmA (M78 family)
MIELITAYSLSNIPYITYEALDEYAASVVYSFAPERLTVPAPLDVDSFIKNYLGLNVVQHKLCYEKQVLGFTAFHDGVIRVYDDRTSSISAVPVSGGTVIIDKSLSGRRNIRRLRFTLTHEGSHWMLHQKAFETENPFGSIGAFEVQYLAAKVGRIDYSRSTHEKSDKDRIERQADFFASAILMPRPALRAAFRNFFRDIGENPRALVRAEPNDDFKAKQLAGYIADTFNVSKRAALIRLEKLNAIVDRKSYFMQNL